MSLPCEVGQEDVVLDLIHRWKADALRDSDGTEMPESLLEQDCEIYSLMCIVRDDQDYARKNPQFMHRKFLSSFPVTAMSGDLAIAIMKGYCGEKYTVDEYSDPKAFWQVWDRTEGTLVNGADWEYDYSNGVVTLSNCEPYHEYTVSFMVRQVWDSTSMYNALTNGWNWQEEGKTQSLDPYHPECRKHLMAHFENWLKNHPNTTVVRFTTFAYAFVIDANEEMEDIYRDWTGYGETVSPQALADFEKRFGYKLTAEDFVDAGYYNGTYKVPTKRFRDWMTFIQDFVADFAGEMVRLANQYGKRTAMFQGDHWIGTETFLDCYQRIGIDINVGAVEDGVALRRLTDSQGEQIKEARFYPYFFNDVFREGNNPVDESMRNWVKIRRAMLQKPLHRIGYGGYLSLANKFPHFIDHVTDISDEFGSYLENTAKTESYKVKGKVAILNAWGKARSWLQQQARDQRFYVPPRPDVMELVGNNVLECLAGLPFDVEFISFEDILENGIPEDIKVIINTGDAGSAWSGGEYWSDSRVIRAVRRFVGNGGGLLGVCDPSAHLQNGRYFQLGDVFGVEKEVALTMGRVSKPLAFDSSHFLSQKLTGLEEFGNPSFVYPAGARVIAAQGQHLALAANDYGKGRAVYLGNLPYSLENASLLENVLLWLTGNETEEMPWRTHSAYVSSAYYPETGKVCLVNNTEKDQTVGLAGNAYSLKPYQWLWLEA
ncbi:1,3-beta-galactosyl-N-acetylhexosamine phosphorylase [Parasalinivibrio latis]|uniref:1,3-beta-galactosyl-N-acetylhexosamine phosphorylase n=1 Tax=Parasalinivibrio latis TaxID=2952610 RepID=UPI0030DE2345